MNNKKQSIRLNESQLKSVVFETIKTILNEVTGFASPNENEYEGPLIGFTSQYYTLWNVRIVERTPEYIKLRYEYIKNISKNKDIVLEKYPNVPFYEGLRGQTRSFNTIKKVEKPDNVFHFGKYSGKKFEDVNDLNYTSWYFGQIPVVTKHYDYVKHFLAQNGYTFEYDDFYNRDKAFSPEQMKSRKEEEDKKKQMLDYLKEKKPISVIANSNLIFSDDEDYYGYACLYTQDFILRFKDYKEMYYNGFSYALPLINGKAKRIKGKKLNIKDYNLVEYDYKPILDVTSFNIEG